MAKRSNRIWLRVAPGNPILDIEPGQRSRKADEWLRIGSTVERLDKVVEKLEKLIKKVGTNGSITVQEEPKLDPSDPRLDPNYERDMKLIKSIMKLGG